jgi:methylmalonyl-CoA mutase cobalamin-binding domain/chain
MSENNSAVYSTQDLIAALLDGDQALAISKTEQLRAQGHSREQIVTEGIEATMAQLDAKCTVAQFNLLEIMLVGRAVMGVIETLYPSGTPPSTSKGTVVLASVKGDVHDLGKEIVAMVLIGKGYHVVDCGKDCPLETLLDTAARENADVIGVSGLLTTVIPQVQRIKKMAGQWGLDHVKILAGGGALKQTTSEILNVDFVAQTAFEGACYLDSRLGKKP